MKPEFYFLYLYNYLYFPFSNHQSMKNFSFWLLISAIVFFSCEGNDSDSEPDTVADINGSVLLFTEGSAAAANSGGMKVTVDGTNPSLSVVTDGLGKFTIRDVPFGTYTLVYEKDGYGTFKRGAVQHKAGGTFLTDIPSFGQLSTTRVTEFRINPSGTSLQVTATTDPGGNSGNRRYLRFFFSTQSTVSSSNYLAFSPTFISQENPFGKFFTANEIAALGLTPGTIVFVRAYGDSFFGNSYVDPVSGKTVFPNLNASSVPAVQVTIP